MLHPMRGFRLNVWQRIGIVLSLVWAVGTAGNAWQSWGDRKDDLDKAYFNCLFKPGTTPSDCDTKDSVRQAAAVRVSLTSEMTRSFYSAMGTAISPRGARPKHRVPLRTREGTRHGRSE